MLAEFYPLQVLLLTVSGIVNRHQANVVDYLVEENRVLKEQLKGRKLRRAVSADIREFCVRVLVI